jgi:hypothetical protein
MIVLKDVVSVELVRGHELRLRFEDGVEGVVDIARIVPFAGVFAPLAEPEYFARVAVLEEHGTIGWPNGADLDPDVLYSLVSEGQPPSYGEDPSPTAD